MKELFACQSRVGLQQLWTPDLSPTDVSFSQTYFYKRLGSGNSLREGALFCRNNLNPPKVTCPSSTDCDVLMTFHMDVQMRL